MRALGCGAAVGGGAAGPSFSLTCIYPQCVVFNVPRFCLHVMYVFILSCGTCVNMSMCVMFYLCPEQVNKNVCFLKLLRVVKTLIKERPASYSHERIILHVEEKSVIFLSELDEPLSSHID